MLFPFGMLQIAEFPLYLAAKLNSEFGQKKKKERKKEFSSLFFFILGGILLANLATQIIVRKHRWV